LLSGVSSQLPEIPASTRTGFLFFVQEAKGFVQEAKGIIKRKPDNIAAMVIILLTV
jgi:hypothetical protein